MEEVRQVMTRGIGGKRLPSNESPLHSGGPQTNELPVANASESEAENFVQEDALSSQQ